MSEPIETPRQYLAEQEKNDVSKVSAWRRNQEADEVYTRMRDPEFVIDALITLLAENHATRKHASDLIMGYGDQSINASNMRLDVMDVITAEVKNEYRIEHSGNRDQSVSDYKEPDYEYCDYENEAQLFDATEARAINRGGI
jgi:hypothetical protein